MWSLMLAYWHLTFSPKHVFSNVVLQYNEAVLHVCVNVLQEGSFVNMWVYFMLSVCVSVCMHNVCVPLYVKVHSSALLLREQFLNVSLAPAGLNFLVLEDYGKNVRENLRY